MASGEFRPMHFPWGESPKTSEWLKENFAATRHCHMGKRARRSSVYSEHQGDKHLEDRISQLPDEILTRILSLLKMREAGRSSVLSHRWRDLWKFTTRLNFDGSQMLKHCHCKNYKQQRSKLVAWVKQVLKLHLRPSLDEFRVSFVGLASRTSCDIEELMNFVMTKRVKILEMDLGLPSDKPYTLSQECYRSFKSPSNLSSIKCLTSLSLRSLNLNGELIEYFLSNCPNLEQLRLFFIGQIVNLNVSGPSVQLKHLEIFQCYLLESIEFCAPKLETFKYLGKPIRLSMGSLPLLAELDISVAFHHQPSIAPIPFSSCLSQIETLKLHIWYPKEFPQVPKLPKLKHLMLEVNNVLAPTFPCFTSLVEAAPSLHKFTYKNVALMIQNGADVNSRTQPARSLKIGMARNIFFILKIRSQRDMVTSQRIYQIPIPKRLGQHCQW